MVIRDILWTQSCGCRLILNSLENSSFSTFTIQGYPCTNIMFQNQFWHAAIPAHISDCVVGHYAVRSFYLPLLTHLNLHFTVARTASALLQNEAGELDFISVKIVSLDSLKGRIMAQVFRDRPLILKARIRFQINLYAINTQFQV